MKGTIKARLIHMLGGYTREEYERDIRFRPEPEIMAQRLHTTICYAQALVNKKEWDNRSNTADALMTIQQRLLEHLCSEISEYVEFTGPYNSDPEYYGFVMKIMVGKPENDQLP